MQTLSCVMLSDSEELVDDFQHLNPKSNGYDFAFRTLISQRNSDVRILHKYKYVINFL